jgi:hypothetical protein
MVESKIIFSAIHLKCAAVHTAGQRERTIWLTYRNSALADSSRRRVHIGKIPIFAARLYHNLIDLTVDLHAGHRTWASGWVRSHFASIDLEGVVQASGFRVLAK